MHPGATPYHHSYATWTFQDAKASNLGKSPPAWRVEEFFGLDPRPAKDVSGAAELRVVDDSPDADLVVLDDAGLGFRDTPDLWPAALQATKRQPQVLMKMARPVAQGPLWKQLLDRHAGHMTVVVPVNDLREMEVQISQGFSWERTAQDLVWELTRNPSINALAGCAHVVVLFYAVGALLLSRTPPGPPRAQLFYDPLVLEGEWQRRFPGRMVGYTTCLLAALARESMQSLEQPDLARGIQAGLRAMRALHCGGYGPEDATTPRPSLAFPVERVVQALTTEAPEFAVVEVRDPSAQLARAEAAAASEGTAPALWTILEDRHRDNLADLARRIALHGVETVLADVPIGRFGALVTVERREIEALRSVQSAIAEYYRQSEQRPLSLAVFGPPGCGKSFAVKQLLAAAQAGDTRDLTFNLSQLRSAAELIGAFHQVRDVGLSGRIPLVFWDEFDAVLDGQPLGWLRYFLAPMQDGSFQEHQHTHAIGRAIFVFAGGTAGRMAAFDPGPSATNREIQDFKQAKGPDFTSRLRGYLDVLGPNPVAGAGASRDGRDPFCVIRRAILLRSSLQRAAPRLFATERNSVVPGTLRIDTGILRAFLEIGRYAHGVRSMETIIAMSFLDGKDRFERSSLPAQDQLDLHTNGSEFLALVRQPELEGDLLEALARQTHAAFCAGKRRDGWTHGPKKSEEFKTHPLLLDWNDLPEVDKHANRISARTIPHKLAAAGYILTPARGDTAPFVFPGPDLERLARLEHELWMAAKLADGWRLGTATPDDPKRNEYLVEWEKVPEQIQQIDRDLINDIPKMLAAVGFTIIKIDNESGERRGVREP